MMLDFERLGQLDSKVLISEGKIAPFTASKLIKESKKIIEKADYIKDFFWKMVELDYDLKQGILPLESFWFEVKKMVLG